MAAVTPKKLNQLNADTNNAIVTALVIAKTEPNFFLSRDTNEYRGVITYTIRDSKQHIVNCKYWGSKEKIEECHRKLKIGDIIDVISPKVLPQMMEQQAHHLRFQPLATLPYTLTINEGQGLLNKHDYREIEICHELRQLLRVPHKPLYEVLKLADVRMTDTSYTTQAQLVDLLVAVAAVRPLRELRGSRSGQMLNCLELVVIDQSLPSGMILTIWNSDWITQAQQYWRGAGKTVLHLVDVKVCYSSFYKSSTLSFTARTLVFENPIGEEAKSLALYAASVPVKDLESAASLPLAEQIVNQMTVKQLYARAEGHLKDDSEQFTAVLYAMVTKFDVDGQSVVTTRKCKSCNRLLASNRTICDLDQCQLAFSMDYSGDKFEHIFNINIQFSDHTGTLVESRVTGSTAEQLLGLTVKEFMQLRDKQKEQLKWRFLMNHYEVKLLVKKVSAVRRNLSITVVNMAPTQLAEISQKIVAF